jgi:signal transduction histidine kinase
MRQGHPRRSPALASALAFTLIFTAGLLLFREEERAARQASRRAAATVAGAAAATVEEQLARSLGAVYALGALVRQLGDVPDFERTADQLLHASGGIATLQLVPGGVIRRTYPLEGHESALGLNLFAGPARPWAEAARASRGLSVDGPFRLKQGGVGLVARLAVFRRGADGEERFWGFVAAVMRWPALLREARIEQLEAQGYDWAIQSSEAVAADPGGVAIESSRALPLDAPEGAPVQVPGGRWMLWVAPRAGWGTGRCLPRLALAFLVSTAFAALAALLVQRRRQAELRLQTAEVIRAQDEERRRIARDLHDSAAQSVFAASLELALARRGGGDGDGDDAIRRAMSSAEDLCQQALYQIRTLSYVLHPPGLDETGLAPAVRWFVKGFATRSEIAATCQAEEVGRLPAEVELALFRVLQEALSNVQRHSGARNVAVSLAAHAKRVVLSVRDDGRGIPRVDLAERAGVGIAGMRERLRLLGGELELSSEAGATELRASVLIGS